METQESFGHDDSSDSHLTHPRPPRSCPEGFRVYSQEPISPVESRVQAMRYPGIENKI